MNYDQTLKDILEIVQFIKDNGATKEEVATKDDLKQVEQRLEAKIDGVEQRLDKRIIDTRNDMVGHVDAFVALYRKHEAELAAVVSRQERLEEKLNHIIKHLGLQLA